MGEETTRRLPDGDLGEALSILRSMDARLTTFEEKVGLRLQETRRISGQVLNRLTALEEEMKEVNRIEAEHTS